MVKIRENAAPAVNTVGRPLKGMALQHSFGAVVKRLKRKKLYIIMAVVFIGVSISIIQQMMLVNDMSLSLSLKTLLTEEALIWRWQEENTSTDPNILPPEPRRQESEESLHAKDPKSRKLPLYEGVGSLQLTHHVESQKAIVNGESRQCTNPELLVFSDVDASTPADQNSSSFHSDRINQISKSRKSNQISLNSCPLPLSSPTGSKTSNWHEYFQKITSLIQTEFQAKCQSSVMVYGAAFGEMHFQTYLGDHPKKNRMASPLCQFWLVLDSSVTHRFSSAQQQRTQSKRIRISNPTPSIISSSSPLFKTTKQGLKLLVLNESMLPFQNNRRNVKLFKMNPHDLFPWAQRVLWADAKLEIPSQLYVTRHYGSNSQPDSSQESEPEEKVSGVDWYYQQTIEKYGYNTSSTGGNGAWTGVCGAVMSLPIAEASVTKEGLEILSSVKYGYHCRAVLQAFEFRRNISDSMESVIQQCKYYLHHDIEPWEDRNGSERIRSKPNETLGGAVEEDEAWALVDAPELDATLIDSAFVAWDFRPNHCREFVAKLLCSWLQEIHCFSDRDQLSFGRALISQLKETDSQQIQRQPALGGSRSTDFSPGGEQLRGRPLSLKDGAFHQHATFQNTSPLLSFSLDKLNPLALKSANSTNRVLFETSTQSPLLVFVKSKCHWYFFETGRDLFDVFKCICREQGSDVKSIYRNSRTVRNWIKQNVNLGSKVGSRVVPTTNYKDIALNNKQLQEQSNKRKTEIKFHPAVINGESRQCPYQEIRAFAGSDAQQSKTEIPSFLGTIRYSFKFNGANHGQSYSCPMSLVSSSSSSAFKFSAYLQKITLLLQKEFQDQCQSQVMIYGAAFDKSDFQAYLGEDTGKSRMASDSCQFWLVLDSTVSHLESYERQLQSLPSLSSLHNPWFLRTDQGQRFLVIHESMLPFQSYLRNIQIFKMNPHNLFPWAQRVLWTDYKLVIPPKIFITRRIRRKKTTSTSRVLSSPTKSQVIEKNFSGVDWYFQETIGKYQLNSTVGTYDGDNSTGACGSAISMPLVEKTMTQEGTEVLSSVNFGYYCRAILQDFEFRQSNLESMDSIVSQCKFYLERKQQDKNDGVENEDGLPSVDSTELDSTLIDSSILAWDFRPSHCRDFVARLSCSWLQEIHCYSDHDQLSFGHAVLTQLKGLQSKQKTGRPIHTKSHSTPKSLHEVEQSPQQLTKPPLVSLGYDNATSQLDLYNVSSLLSFSVDKNTLDGSVSPESSDRVLLDTTNQLPLMVFVKSKCHWYLHTSSSYDLYEVFKCFARQQRGKAPISVNRNSREERQRRMHVVYHELKMVRSSSNNNLFKTKTTTLKQMVNDG